MTIDYAAKDLLIRPEDQERTASDMKIVARSAKLSGHFSIMEGEVRPRELLSFHTHDHEDQHMYIVSGTLHLEVGGADGIRFTATAGDHVLKPRGTTHGFWNLGDTPVRYIETSTQDGFERFVDGRADGVSAMVSQASEALGMSFQTARTLEVMKEHDLTGLAGLNMSKPEALLADRGILELLRKDEAMRELVLYLAGSRLRGVVEDKLASLPRFGAC